VVALALEFPRVLEGLSTLLLEADTGVRSVQLHASSNDVQRRINTGHGLDQAEVYELVETDSVRLVFLHEDTPLELEELSDGTRRLLLGIGWYAITAHTFVVVFIDELDRSFHTALTRHFMRLLHRQSGRAQFVFTTHDTNLLDAGVFGRDAIWFVEKDKKGAAHIYSLAEFDRSQLDALTGKVEQGYLLGRFGAIPFQGDPIRLRWSSR
jgi:hypothetical protein